MVSDFLRNGCKEALFLTCRQKLQEPHHRKEQRLRISVVQVGSRKVTACGGGTSETAYKVVVQSSANHVVDLSWKASTTGDVTGYNVYRSPDGSNWKRIKYSDSTVANGSTYYAATAVDIYGHESNKTAPIKVAVP